MNRAYLDAIANAVLYEGYLLYPYRPSIKNHQRWTFGGLYPESFCKAQKRGDASSQQTECLVLGTSATTLKIVVRFLHQMVRRVGAFDPPLSRWTNDAVPPLRLVEMLQIGSKRFYDWQEVREREVPLMDLAPRDLCAFLLRRSFRFDGYRGLEPLQGPTGDVEGAFIRTQQAIEGLIDVAAEEVEEGLFRLTTRVINHTPLKIAACISRDDVQKYAFLSTHVILAVEHGEFISLMDPPERFAQAAAACNNIGAWPVLVGQEGQKDTMLSSPIILYDYPQVAPESPRDFFDGTEIDELLTLRIMTLTDEEKAAMASVDERGGALLRRTLGTARESLSRLHGTVRGLPEASAEGQE